MEVPEEVSHGIWCDKLVNLMLGSYYKMGLSLCALSLSLSLLLVQQANVSCAQVFQENGRVMTVKGRKTRFEAGRGEREKRRRRRPTTKKTKSFPRKLFCKASVRGSTFGKNRVF